MSKKKSELSISTRDASMVDVELTPLQETPSNAATPNLNAAVNAPHTPTPLRNLFSKTFAKSPRSSAGKRMTNYIGETLTSAHKPMVGGAVKNPSVVSMRYVYIQYPTILSLELH